MWSRSISAFHLWLHSSTPTVSVLLAGITIYKHSHYILSQTQIHLLASDKGKEKCQSREWKIHSVLYEYKNGSSCSTQVTTQTFATPTPVNRASNSSCRRGSRLWSSSIMAAETRAQIKEDIAGAGSVGIVKWESCLTVSLDMMSHGCI